jgi:hypothetical protein
MSRRSRIRKRKKQKRFHKLRPKPADKPIASPTTGLISELAKPTRAIAFAAALSETQHTNTKA